MKIKPIALGCFLETMIFWFQTNPEIRCSPAMHNVQEKTKKLKVYHFKLIYGAVFLNTLCLYLYLSQNLTLRAFLDTFLTLW